MKSLRMILLLVIAVGSISVIQAEKDECVEKVGNDLHRLAHDCKTMSNETIRYVIDYDDGIRKSIIETTELNVRMSTIIDDMKKLKASQALAALNFEIDGKNAISIAELASCEVCNEYTTRLKILSKLANFVVNELEAGDLIEEDFLQRPDLVEKISNYMNNQGE